jgi:DUF438 domain-containing protein
MSEVETLKHLLERMNNGENPEKVRREAREFLVSLSPGALSVVEQELMDSGVAPEELQKLCSVHMEVVGGELEKIKSVLPIGHVIDTLICEHSIILDFVDELEELNQSIQQMKSFDKNREEFVKLVHIAEYLISTEPHQQREEEVLFPEMEKRGIYGSPQLMRFEHKELRNRKKQLRELAATVDDLDFEAFKKILDALTRHIAHTLKEHVNKENNILYPTALKVIPEVEVWEKLKTDCDHIGYCCFTPNVSKKSLAVSSKTHTLDLRSMMPFERHDRIFRIWDSMTSGETLRLINDRDPKPLHHQFQEEYRNQIRWEYERQGPRDWIVRIHRI